MNEHNEKLSVAAASENLDTATRQTVKMQTDADINMRYDAQIKQVLALKPILALILKYSIDELNSYNNEEIQGFIENNISIGEDYLEPSYSDERIDGMTQESHNPSEAKITYDIKFRMSLPMDDEGAFREVIINLEAQNNFNPGYDIAKRGIYYASRLISEQLSTAKDSSVYNKLRKVYSIWLFPDPPKEHGEADSITEFKMTKHKKHGNFNRDVEYDLISMIFICLSENSHHNMIDALQTLLSEKCDYKTKEEKLINNGIKLFKPAEKGVIEMCNLSQGVEARGIEKGLAQGIIQGREQGIVLGQTQEREKSIRKTVSICKSACLSEDFIIAQLVKEFDLTEKEAQQYL